MGVKFIVTVGITVPAWAASIVRMMTKSSTPAPSMLHALLKERAPAGIEVDSVSVEERS